MDLREAVHQQRALDPAGHVLAKAILDQFPRRMTGTETGHLGRRHQLAELLVQVAIDVLARHGHGDVPLAGAAVVDLDVQIQPGLFFLALFALVGDRLIGDDFSRSQNPLVLQGFIVVVRICVCHDGMLLAGTWNSHPETDLAQGPGPARSQARKSATGKKERAGDGIRTHDNDVGNVVLYQLSYTRPKQCGIIGSPEPYSRAVTPSIH